MSEVDAAGYPPAPDVVFWTPDRSGSRFYRCDQPAHALTTLGHRALVTPVLCHSWVRAHTVVGQRVATPGHTEVWGRLAGQRDAGLGPRRLVFDMDDDYFDVPETTERAHHHYAKPEIRANLQTNMRLADVVTVCSQRQAEVARRYNPNVVITPNTLPSSTVRDPLPYIRGSRPVVVGWAGSPGAHHDLDVVAPALRQLSRRRNVVVHLIGIPASIAAQKGLTGDGVRVTPWVSGTLNYLRAVDFDVWVAPYRDLPFNHAKFPTKVLESRILGVPLAASPVDEYVRAAGDGRGGPLIVNDDAWPDTLEWITQTHRSRDEFARWAAACRHHHITETRAPEWVKTLLG